MVLLLDGLDEIAIDEYRLERATTALSELSRSGHSALISCRSELAEQLAIRNALPIEVPALTTSAIGIDEIVRRVRRSCTSEDIANHLEAALRSNPTGALANRLSVPLFLRVLVDMVVNNSEAIELERLAAAPAWDDDLNSVESHLFGAWIAQAAVRPQLKRSENGSRGIKRYTAESIKTWSQSIARYLHDFGGFKVGGDVVPHTLILPHYLWVIAGPNRVRAAVVLLTLFLWAPLLVCFWLVSLHNAVDHTTTLILIPLLGLAIALSFVMVLGVIRPLRINVEHLTTRAGLVQFGLPRLGLAALITFGLAVFMDFLAGASSALAFAGGFFIAFGLGLATAVRPDIDLMTAGWSAAAVGAAIQLATLGLVESESWRLALIIGAGAGAAALIAAVAAGSIVWKRSGRENLAFRRPRSADPFFRLRADMNTAGIVFVLAGAITFLAIHFTQVLTLSLPYACAVAIFAGLAAGPGLVSVAWRRYVCMLLVAHRKLPFRLRLFLEWCYEAGLLRRSAAAYEFRHEQLRIYLAGLPPVDLGGHGLPQAIQRGRSFGPMV